MPMRRVKKPVPMADTASEDEFASDESMKINDPNLTSLASTGPQQTDRSSQGARSSNTNAAGVSAASGDDIHLSELVRSLRSLAADSPERQARLEQIARSYANGNYKVDAESTASKIIDDALQS
jgi:flagellar biosynthesis anti-sigma factor FlgM